ncbi:DUF2383 domain-containing protein [Alteromonas sp. C1M14]|uniref:DUF2383 domain-containing protein n=1 Tax=Alteromonas sp. C1M14 TaxID=2841567 RepID=UPI001C0A011F|nr:DUF2383 domain-containing protein [Alteromonas sp. C1M14]MBU2977177.1 PA2169 family four-helix-bundle protein [Alteromonas sp. C1M14]
MSSRYQRNTMLPEIINVLNDGLIFYQQGITRTRYDRVRAMCTRMVEEKRLAIRDLSPFQHRSDLAPNTRLAWGQKIKNDYETLQNALATDKEAALSKRLNHIENRILQSFDDALDADVSNECAQALRKVRSRMLQCHDELMMLAKQVSA